MSKLEKLIAARVDEFEHGLVHAAAQSAGISASDLIRSAAVARSESLLGISKPDPEEEPALVTADE